MIKKPSISAVIIAKNEAAMIEACIKTLKWCDSVLVIDSGSHDQTPEIAEKMGAKVIHFNHSSFARLRNEALKHLESDWIFYIDADERVTPTLAKEILVVTETAEAAALVLNRQNYFFGTLLHHGGWQNDKVTRIFHKLSQVEWFGDIHESPKFQGKQESLKSMLVHFSHRDVASGLIKSAMWTPREAKLLAESNIPPVTFWTVLRKGLGEFRRRNFKEKGYKDGLAGQFEALIQAINRMLVYIQVWELQQQPSIIDKYQKLENDIADKWKNNS